jgi:hypothetical protein
MRGFLDSLTYGGYFEGWAFDPSRPLHALSVAVMADNKCVAQGRAHLFRRDLMEAQCGTGWCALRLRHDTAVELPTSPVFALVECDSGIVLYESRHLAAIADPEREDTTIEKFCASDPTLITDIGQLRGCEGEFTKYIYTHGVDYFLRTAHIYVLGRPADDDGLVQYGHLLRLSKISPLGVIETLASSEEFSRTRRELVCPNAREFPFK